jgi:hypothetical protein
MVKDFSSKLGSIKEAGDKVGTGWVRARKKGVAF